MSSKNVIFRTGTKAQYDALAIRDPKTLYWLSDVLELRKGDELYGTGALATAMANGLMSAEDKKKLDQMVISDFTPVDSSIVIMPTDSGKTIGVRLSSSDGNAAVIKEDGLFVPIAAVNAIPEYSIERQAGADEGYAATYRLKRSDGDTVSYVGDAINIPQDVMLKSGSLETVIIADQPYVGAQIGDPYVDLVLADEANSHIYIPVKGLVDKYVAGNGLSIENGVFEVKVDPANANGLFVAVEGVSLALATPESAGAMSAEDKRFIDSIPETFVSEEKLASVVNFVEYEIVDKPEGTLVDYRDKEVRIMCPSDTEWHTQAVGPTGNANNYYIPFRAYAPNSDVVSFKESMDETITDDTMFYFEDNSFAGIDEFGRKYSLVWLAVAALDPDTGTWTYYGEKSSDEKYIGWYYSVEWYDANGIRVDADTIRINLSNENCHTGVEPYFVANYATTETINELKETITELEQGFTWGDM